MNVANTADAISMRPYRSHLQALRSWFAGDWELDIRKQPGTMIVTVHSASAAATQRAEPAPQAPLSSSVWLDGLQVDLWDDERRRLSNGRAAASSSGGAQRISEDLTTAERQSQWPAPTPLGARLFCISVDGVHLELSRCQVLGAIP